MEISVDVATNLKVLKRSRTRPQAGDVFAMQLPDNRYLFGRVIGADIPRERAPMPGANLIYVYDVVTDCKEPASPLLPDNLLLPPVFTNRLPWTKGYFETVEHRTLHPQDLLPRHCFQGLAGELFDESGRRLDRRSEPCGVWGVASYRRLDDLISDAVNIPRCL